jgi:hypothetical protein
MRLCTWHPKGRLCDILLDGIMVSRANGVSALHIRSQGLQRA